jgi:transcriptional regulator with XRE-family HTH domain
MTAEKANFYKLDESDAKQQIEDTSDIDSAGLVLAADKKLPELKKVFGKNLARIRREAGYSQAALSFDTGMTRNFINDLEQGTKGASFLTLAKLSVILRTSAHEFFEPEGRALPTEEVWYSDPVGRIADQLHEASDTWNSKRAK